MSNIKMICPQDNLSSQVIKLSAELTDEMAKRKLTCQCIKFIMQDNENQVQRHTLELEQPTSNVQELANLLVVLLKNYKGNQSPKYMCLQISKLRVA